MPINRGRKILSTFCVMLMVSMIFQTVSAEIETYTMDDGSSNITISTGQQFNISIQMTDIGEWQLAGYDLLGGSGYYSSILEIVEGKIWIIPENPGTNDVIFNLTFEGIKAGNDIITYNHHRYWDYPDQPIDDNFTFNVTVIGPEPINIPMIIIVVIIIAVVPSAIIIKWIKGERKHEK